ncbi:MAG: AMIN domain-containing protein [bacterium]
MQLWNSILAIKNQSLKNKNLQLSKKAKIYLWLIFYLFLFSPAFGTQYTQLLDIEVKEGDEKNKTEVIFITEQPAKYSLIRAFNNLSAKITFEDTINSWWRETEFYEQGIIKKINVVQGRDFTTIAEIEFRIPVIPLLKSVNNTVVLTAVPTLKQEEYLQKEKESKELYQIKDIDIKEEEGQIRVIIKTSNTPILKHFRTEDPSLIVIDFLECKCEYTRKKIKKNSYISFISIIQLLTTPTHISRITIGLMEPSLVSQITSGINQVEVEIKEESVEKKKSQVSPQQILPEKEVGASTIETIKKEAKSLESSIPASVKRGEIQVKEEPKKEEPLITNVFFETDISQALRDISTQAKIPIIPDDTVRGVITVELQDVPLSKALEMVLAPKGYMFCKFDNYYLVGLADPTGPSFVKLTSTEFLNLNYLQAQDLLTLIPQSFLSFIQVNKEKNLVTITAPGPLIERIKNDIALIDIPPQQVAIESLIAEVSKEGIRSIGTNWNFKWKDSSVTLKKETDKTSKLSYTITNDLTSQALITFIDMLVKEGKAEIKANPKVVTLTGQQAKIKLSREEFYQLLSGRVGYESVTLKAIESGIILDITPYISQKGEITVKIISEVGDVAGEGTPQGLPIINKRNVETKVRVKEGETIIIGGLTQKKKKNSLVKIPVLGSIPIIGFFFKQVKTITEETEVMIFITPHIIKS